MKTQTEIELIDIGLEWCSRFKSYSELTLENDVGNKKAVLYNNTWVRLIRRIKNYTEDNKNLIQLYNFLRNTVKYNQELKEIILKNLEEEGIKREMIYFMSFEDGQQLIDEIFKGGGES